MDTNGDCPHLPNLPHVEDVGAAGDVVEARRVGCYAVVHDVDLTLGAGAGRGVVDVGDKEALDPFAKPSKAAPDADPVMGGVGLSSSYGLVSIISSHQAVAPVV